MSDQRRITTLAILKSLIEASGGCDQVIAIAGKGGPLEQAVTAALGVHDRVLESVGTGHVAQSGPAGGAAHPPARPLYDIEELDRKSPTRLRVKLRPFDREEQHPGWVTAWDRHGEAIEKAGTGARIEGKLVKKGEHLNVEVLS